MIYLAIILILILIFSFNKASKLNKKELGSTKTIQAISIGGYFFEKSEFIRKNRSNIPNSQLLMDYYWILGCATQGRVDETKKGIKEANNTPLQTFFDSYKPQVMKMAKIAKEVDDKPIGYDLKNGESIGEYFDRKVSKRPAFMKEFEFFKNFNIEEFLNSTPTI